MLNENIKKTIKEKYAHYHAKHIEKTNLKTYHLVIIFVVGLLFCYYGLIGGILNSKIRKDLEVEIKEASGLKTLGVASHIIDLEVQKNLWTPSLPLFFPTYFLDDLPNFQLGQIRAVSQIIKSLTTLAKTDEKLLKASTLLSYDGTIWMFEKGGVLPVPSAASQYKKGRRLLIKSNPLANGLMLDNAACLYLITTVKKDLSKSLKSIDKAIVEDTKIDDSFYYNQGKIYVYSLFLKAFVEDYKNVFVETNTYEPMTSAIKALENATQMSPSMVKNSEPSSMAANHLYIIGYYLQRAISKLGMIQKGLQQQVI